MTQRLLGDFCLAPAPQVDGIDNDAEKIRRNEAHLRRLNPYDANDYAINRCQDPAFPAPSTDQNCGNHCKHAGQIVKPQHGCKTSLSVAVSCNDRHFFYDSAGWHITLVTNKSDSVQLPD
jgi:hypothetical protein